jgi:hypothetical protein
VEKKSEENVLTGGRLFGGVGSESIKGSVLESSHMDVEVPLDRFCRNGGYGGLSSRAYQEMESGWLSGNVFSGKIRILVWLHPVDFLLPPSGSEISITDFK